MYEYRQDANEKTNIISREKLVNARISRSSRTRDNSSNNNARCPFGLPKAKSHFHFVITIFSSTNENIVVTTELLKNMIPLVTRGKVIPVMVLSD